MIKMRRKNKDDLNEEEIEQSTIQYSKPKVMLIDLPENIVDDLKQQGYNAVNGTFGKPYKVEISDKYKPVIAKASLPNYSERELIFIDLTPPESMEQPEGNEHTPESEPNLWAKCHLGEIDPRPRIMNLVKDDFDQIFRHGGLFVVFAQPRSSQNFVWGKVRYRELEIDSESKIDNWSFSSLFSIQNLIIDYHEGEEIHSPELNDTLSKFLLKNTKHAKYTATFEPTYRISGSWIPLLSDKFGRTVSAQIKFEENKGRVLILPKMKINSSLILNLMKDVLPELSPHLFPHIEGAKWVERSEYELISILNLKKAKYKVQKKAQEELDELDNEINEEREKYEFLYGILNKTGNELVESVVKTLDFFGFKKILNIDDQIKEMGSKLNMQEDLQIHDKSPTLLIEVKGIGTLPSESDTLQVIKYVSRRMKEWKRTDVRGISIINQQRNIPALDRDNQNVFTEQQIDDAVNSDITLISTWDLFLLARGMLQWGWDGEKIRNLFYVKGKLSRIPLFYLKLGDVFNYWDKMGVVGINIKHNKLIKGQKIAYVLPNGYLEEVVDSIQVNNEEVDKAESDQLVGIKSIYSKDDLKKGTQVFIVDTYKNNTD